MLPEKQPYSEKLACDPQRSVIVSACAGSGKTWLLVSRMIRLLLAGAKPQEILALTFTRKAAQEMRDRLFQLLEEFSSSDDAALADQLIQRGIAKEDVNSSARHVGCNSHCTFSSGLSNNRCFSCVVFSIQNFVRNSFTAQGL